jgi:hypothetical protein
MAYQDYAHPEKNQQQEIDGSAVEYVLFQGFTIAQEIEKMENEVEIQRSKVEEAGEESPHLTIRKSVLTSCLCMIKYGL